MWISKWKKLYNGDNQQRENNSSLPGGTTENQRVTHMSNPSLFLPLCDINSTNNG